MGSVTADLHGPDEKVREGQAHLKHFVLKTREPFSPHDPVLRSENTVITLASPPGSRLQAPGSKVDELGAHAWTPDYFTPDPGSLNPWLCGLRNIIFLSLPDSDL